MAGMNSPVVSIKQGSLRGTAKTTLNGKPYSSFLGIPYAKPPVGPLRFTAPQPAESWSGVRDATVEGSACSSKHMVFRNFIGTEDCLFLNVYTPKLFAEKEQFTDAKAVMVWIHGGGFAMGSSELAMYGPNFLLDGDVVLVTINYRLGPLGFLSTGDGVCPGNWGLKDQAFALKWVQQNIHAFGGDPSRVTIFGESAGGASVHYHVLSPMSKGLFHRAIAQSGAALNPWAYRAKENARSLAFTLGKSLGFTGSTSEELVKFLQGIDVKELVLASEKVCPQMEKLAGITFAFVPTTEDDGPNAFLPGVPAELNASGKFNKDITFITGVTTDEGFVVEFGESSIYKNPPILNSIDQNIEVFVPKILGLPFGSEKSKAAAQKIRNFFFGDKPLTMENISHYYDSQTDLLFLLGIDLVLQAVSLYSSKPTYFYQFSFEGLLGIGKKVIGIDNPGVCHGDELGYLFSMDMLPVQEMDPESPERKMINHFVTWWTNIAKSGNPNSETGVNWESMPKNLQQVKFLDINEVVQMKCGRGPHGDRLKFWDSLLKEFGGENNIFDLKLKEKL
ncbi:esterase FE4-like [Ischnura elegans]|uniref:esterase FE4-like n=1 Tax=Ischnura elegans TaxID=197161 RepID=UPI001ED86E5E|nr:esterase FE4-like [Ischnura elegans]XP_046404431.1 esterase FE4-like [Ischnura elegans]